MRGTRGWSARVVLASVVLMLAITPMADAKPGGGNSGSAKLCNKGGWEDLYTEDGEPFSSEDECVSYGAQGGTPTPAEDLEQLVFARAYSTMPDGTEVLIARLVDTNWSREIDAGDTVETNQYPLDRDATTFGSFTVKSHVITGVYSQTSYAIGVQAVDESREEYYLFEGGTSTLERYDEYTYPGDEGAAYTYLTDCVGAEYSCLQYIEVTEREGVRSPSWPELVGTFYQEFDQPADDPFINVELVLP